ncbi:uncharacterized protein EI90DRAFT_460114 [Cantharellus anzutake]|uniref:uncharacterized protein n=1 Tax=Cantharellus anzutake TaxID=1750568 RepID=UPI00190865A7|nr:uncharacterized protein EI90DRAFT_460114 [Cantharellus anzutake]KAF8334748.1 hypothetical protein EI90DRAFT_460114 [Cantharellus anzutake]
MDDSSSNPPDIHVRWFQVDVPELLSIAPITLNPNPTWKALTRVESDACELAWRNLKVQGPVDTPTVDTVDDHIPLGKPFDPQEVAAVEAEDVTLGVPVGKEQLFEVDVRTMKVRDGGRCH